MLDKISRWFYLVSSWRMAAFSLLLFLAFCLTLLPSQSAQLAAFSGGAGSPDTSLFYSPADLSRMAESYGAAGRQAYIQARFTFDLAFPLVYTCFLAITLSCLFGQSLAENNPWRRLNLIPLAAMFFDFLENICAARVMAAYPAAQPLAAALAMVFTPLKWLFVSGSFLLLLPAIILFFQKSRNI
jgi:hypothetical protein